MPELNDHIANINSKLQQLLKQYEQLLKEHKQQQQRLATAQDELKKNNEQLELLEQQNLVLKASVASLNPADKKAMELKLNQYIKNIDKCISLISQ